jgi:hypothetical protein
MIDDEQILDDIIELFEPNNHFSRHQINVLRTFAIDLSGYIDARLENFKEINNIGDI